MNADSVEYIISFIFTVAMLACLTCIACRLTDILHAIRNLHNFCSYQKDGQSIKRWEVRVDDVELMQYKRDAQSPAPANAAAPGLAMATGDPSPVAPVQPAAPDLYDDDVPF